MIHLPPSIHPDADPVLTPCGVLAHPLSAALAATDPLDLYRRLVAGSGAEAGGNAVGRPGPGFLLDGTAAPDRSRYSYIGVEPYAWLEVAGRQAVWRGPHAARLGAVADPFDALAAALAPTTNPPAPGGDRVEGLPPFQGGAVGFLGYEMGGWLERLPAPRRRAPSPTVDGAMSDMVVGLYDSVLAIDHAVGAAWLLASGRPETGPDAEAAARGRLARWRVWLETPPPALPAPSAGGVLRPPGWRAALPRAAHEAAVARAVEYIHAGDIFQANITQRFLAEVPPEVGAVALYQRVRAATRAPHAALLELVPGGRGPALVSGSPERFIALDAAGRLETRPIKGTRPRGPDATTDAALAADLLASPKDRAENLMIVDLLRNDLARVARVGSVAVPTLCGLESYATVHHLVSVVTADLDRRRPGLGPVDVLRAAFPGGSITGAPKVRAMEIIHELERAPRGPYCGSVVWMGWDGAMDSSIIIRSLVVEPVEGGAQVTLQAGGGIVADSDPAAEYEESLVKARALMRALDPGAML